MKQNYVHDMSYSDATLSFLKMWDLALFAFLFALSTGRVSSKVSLYNAAFFWTCSAVFCQSSSLSWPGVSIYNRLILEWMKEYLNYPEKPILDGQDKLNLYHYLLGLEPPLLIDRPKPWYSLVFWRGRQSQAQTHQMLSGHFHSFSELFYPFSLILLSTKYISL